MDGQLRLMEGGAGAGFEFGRLEIFLRGLWSNICSGDSESFTQDSAQVACRLLGFDGGASVVFRQPFIATKNPVSIPHNVVFFMTVLPLEVHAERCLNGYHTDVRMGMALRRQRAALLVNAYYIHIHIQIYSEADCSCYF